MRAGVGPAELNGRPFTVTNPAPAETTRLCQTVEGFRAARDPPSQRVDDAIHVLRSKQQPDGTWLLENTHPGEVHFTLEDGDHAITSSVE